MSLADIFGPEGLLSQTLPYFRARPSQLAMAETIEATLQENQTLVAEAGTGTGKTFAYLVPALLSGRRVLLSTATKTLQDQLFSRDLPTVRQALGLPLTLALLKGRENYLCLYRLNHVQQTSLFKAEIDQLQTIRQWANLTQSGDKAELSSISDQASIWWSVTSTRENCLGGDCPCFEKCFVMQARREAQCADVVVVNHHLFLADLVLKEQEVGELLPEVGVMVFDEAHQLPEIATAFFSETVSTAQLAALGQDINSAVVDLPIDRAVFSQWMRQWDSVLAALRGLFPPTPTRLSKTQLRNTDQLDDALMELEKIADGIKNLLEQLSDGRPEIELILTRLDHLTEKTTAWRAMPDENHMDWIETTLRYLRLQRTPISPATALKPHWEKPGAARIFLSATLAVDRDFSHFIEEMGLTAPQTGFWESPFHYEHQTLLYVPFLNAAPNEPGFTEAVVTEAMSLMPMVPGGAFFLFTSLAAVERAKTLLLKRMDETGERFTLLVQGDQSRSELLKRFRADGHAILLGSYSFWEGVDVAGPSLSFVLIDKIPFQPPDDPLLMAKSDKWREAGKNPFLTLQLPKAVISLKQGAGRLIRSEADCGILMIGDNRLFTKFYGKKILKSLPFSTLTRDHAIAMDFFQQHSEHSVD